ncbi:MAG: hypothetical protein A07HR60_02726 [uncultured archaeon A07HR60]|nr:MAG: hypothetical protein J07HR59_00922 [Halorubrum sp. J07HR59]ESS10708.1 MAG: hypothetical protein A07HR60_02726 [uncultured archaeon A07HR60]
MTGRSNLEPPGREQCGEPKSTQGRCSKSGQYRSEGRLYRAGITRLDRAASGPVVEPSLDECGLKPVESASNLRRVDFPLVDHI